MLVTTASGKRAGVAMHHGDALSANFDHRVEPKARKRARDRRKARRRRLETRDYGVRALHRGAVDVLRIAASASHLLKPLGAKLGLDVAGDRGMVEHGAI